jgi:hypothetical protein
MTTRENRFIVPLAVLSAAALVAVWFPFSTLLGQSGQLSSSAREIATLRSESRELAVQQKAMSTNEANILLAREEYQLVSPGQRLVQILNTSNSTTPGNGDPGLQPLVDPSSAADLTPGNPTDPTASSVHPSTLWSRVAGTLEFWR